jgi:mono/diheme cytochrome c family protein
MKASFRWLPLLSLCLSAVTVSGFVFVTRQKAPNPSAFTSRKFEPTPARLARGRYLTEGPMHCFVCHSETSPEDLLPLPGKKGGGRTFPEGAFPFTVRSPNITPDPETGAGKWPDEVFVRVLRDGIGQDGRVLYPLMPYEHFRRLTDEDLASVIVYIRSLPPVRRKPDGPYIPDEVRKTLKPIEPMRGSPPEPDRNDPVQRGEYLATLAACDGCHSRDVPGMRFGGGGDFQAVWGVSSANITPDPSGISYYDEKMFLEVIRTGHVKARALKPVMLWRYFRNMTDDDLKAIFAYLRTVPPVQHRVDNTEPPTPCKLCRSTHGGGVWNDGFATKLKGSN